MAVDPKVSSVLHRLRAAPTQTDLALLGDVGQAMRDASICGLGQAAPNPLLCVLKYFPDELSKPLGSW